MRLSEPGYRTIKIGMDNLPTQNANLRREAENPWMNLAEDHDDLWCGQWGTRENISEALGEHQWSFGRISVDLVGNARRKPNACSKEVGRSLGGSSSILLSPPIILFWFLVKIHYRRYHKRHKWTIFNKRLGPNFMWTNFESNEVGRLFQ